MNTYTMKEVKESLYSTHEFLKSMKCNEGKINLSTDTLYDWVRNQLVQTRRRRNGRENQRKPILPGYSLQTRA